MARIEIRAEVAGKVWKIEAGPGAVLAEGAPVLILESMKMEVPVEAPRAGTLVELRVGPDELVEEDQLLAVLEV
ncbi:MAG: acetyl-CoA carboxylase biotin carboxyl carrier protein subunit [Alphaproteobacteria bacterium]|nr:acetyl-CoA carboxylase biotin carboxyl carrier protein subunit [Alphaproteobacteria bacterium]